MRTSINSRERKRMHDLNEAMEELRSCLPYSQDASSRKMSKINTLLLACNWYEPMPMFCCVTQLFIILCRIRQLTIRNHELQKQLAALRGGEQITVPAPPPAAFTIVPAPLAFGIGPAPCVKAFGQNCFCITCLTSVSQQ